MSKALGMLGLARRAGKVLPGMPLTQKAVRGGRARLVIIASDASENTKKAAVSMCTYYRTGYEICFDKEQLSGAIGTADTAVMTVTDAGFAKAILDKIRSGS